MSPLRQLVWIYLWLLIFEGALRKWILPQLDAPLLVIRDPVVIAIYLLALKERLSFQNRFFLANLALAVLTVVTTALFGKGNAIITLFGLRTDFLQVPLIFLLPQILHRDDVLAMGRFLLWAAIPIGILALLQFRSSPDSWLNKGAMPTPYGSVRPSGVFSFTSGLVAFFDLATAFVLYGFIRGGTYRIWLLSAATSIILLGAACSGSRSCLVSIGLVAAVAILCVLIQGHGKSGIMVAGLLIFGVFMLLSTLPVFQDATAQMTQRIDDASRAEGGAEGFVDRFLSTFLGPLSDLGDVPMLGNGLGIGTNMASSMLYGEREFIGPESEWGRLIFESGPILGLCLCLFRTVLAFFIGWRAFEALRQGNMLPPLIFAACGLLVFNGQWGVPTLLGFAIFGAGLTLAACEEPAEDEVHDAGHEEHHDEDAPEKSTGPRMMDRA